ncbi:SH3 domain-containing protein [Phyllobacterium myrsinacearum]|uniref:SH3-like domain-containing protein n=1 Tax=Phyllobacterium myrsinacearum TaxID=28101 RepID=A0A839EPT7_9HYPH|nr:SH3 domain-containing protein [Phyllobacterium myrsinacearum]MBA8882101.1 SH3-like domain-containing protein [Phyllobacterium myrsinacearum]
MRRFLFWAVIIVAGISWLGSHKKDVQPSSASLTQPSPLTPPFTNKPPATSAPEMPAAPDVTETVRAKLKAATGKTVFVRGKAAALRAGPGKNFSIIDRYDNGREVTLLETQTDWSQIRDNLTQKEGWISAKRLSETKPAEALKRETSQEPEALPKPKIEIPRINDTTIVQSIIAQSIAVYPGSCPCPYNTERGGRRCGKRSAYKLRIM